MAEFTDEELRLMAQHARLQQKHVPGGEDTYVTGFVAGFKHATGPEGDADRRKKALDQALAGMESTEIEATLRSVVFALYGPDLEPDYEFNSDTLDRVTAQLETWGLIPED